MTDENIKPEPLPEEQPQPRVFFSASRNAFFLEALQPQYGDKWPADGVPITDEQHATYRAQPPAGMLLGADAQGSPVWVPGSQDDKLTPAQRAARMDGWVQNVLQSVARSYGYDTIYSAISWADDPNPTFSAEGQSFKLWRSQLYAAVVPLMNAVRAGGPLPDRSTFTQSLPAFVPPQGSAPLAN